jgi:hypothetical protein
MKTVIPWNTLITREQVLENIKANKGVCYFRICVDWDDTDIDALNYMVDDVVDNGTYLNDLSYTPMKLNKDKTLLIEVCAPDTEDYIAQCKEDEEGECID